MLDPLSPPPKWLQSYTQPFADYLALPTLTPHIHEIFLSFAFYQIVQSVVSPWLSTVLFPKIYPHFPRRTRVNWDIHVVSLVQSSLINIIALWVMLVNEERRGMTSGERVYGYDGACGMVQALATGYFVWDLIVSTVHVKIFGVGLWFHAISALWVFSLGFVSSRALLISSYFIPLPSRIPGLVTSSSFSLFLVAMISNPIA